MKGAVKIILFVFLGIFLWSGISLGANITIPDLLSSGTGWNGAQEDNEVENSNLQNQAWDLEAFLLNGNTLTLVGGYNFKDGQADPYYTSGSTSRLSEYLSGDIFLATAGSPTYGPAAQPATGGNARVVNLNGYNYVLDLNFGTMAYDVIAIDTKSEVKTVWFDSNYEGNPWIYWSGGTMLQQGLSLSYKTELTDAQTGFQGGSHNALSVDLSFLDPGTAFYAHFTQQCGNDNIMGYGTTPVPEPATMLLLGSGLIGLAGFGRKKLFKKS